MDRRGCLSFNVRYKMKLPLVALIAFIAFLSSSAQSAVTYVTHNNPTFPIGVLPNPYASMTLDGSAVWLIVGSIDSLPSSLSIVEILATGSNREIYAVTSSPIVEVFAPQLGFPGGTSATYYGGFSFSDDELEALESGSVALFSTHSDGTSQTQRFTVQTIPEPSVHLLLMAGASVGATRRTRKRTRRSRTSRGSADPVALPPVGRHGLRAL